MAALALAILGSPVSGRAAGPIHVDSPLDNDTGGNGPCTLREAINNANSTTGDTTGGDCEAGDNTTTVNDDIVFDADYTITLNSQLPDITSTMTITGNGAGSTIIQANAAPNTATHRVFYVGGDLTLDGVTVRNGRCVVGCAHDAYSGGGIYVATSSSLHVMNSAISSNEARGSTGSVGGGIFAASGTTITIDDSTISGNSAVHGGGLLAIGTTTITGGTFSNNSASGYTGNTAVFGGAIDNLGGSLTISNSVFDMNTAVHTSEITGYGGAIWTQDPGSLHVTDTTFSYSSADLGGAIFHYDGTADFTGTTFKYNAANNSNGGAIYSQQDATLTITNSTFTGNSGFYGSAVLSPGATNVVSIANSTFSDNGTGEALDVGNGTLNMENTILANSTGGTDCTLPSGTMGSDINNLIESNAAGPDNCGTPVSTSDPKLGILTNNGGPTETMALVTGSPAIDAGDDATCAAAPVNGVDQRGATRPVGPHCDIGAYEGEVFPAPTDFQPDGKTDPTKYVSGAGAVFYFQSTTGTWNSAFIGTDGDYVLNSDFDGDGKTDPAKYVSAAGAVWYLGSSDGAWHGVYIGSDGDFIPASDFDGDGTTDPAKYVAAAGAVWYFGSADSTWHGVYIGGLGGGNYVPGSDFDGDGKTDPAHTDSSGNVWYLGSTDSTLHGLFIGNDGPYVPRSDYDGDGKTDPAKFVSPNIWYLASNNSNALSSLALGADTTFVVPGGDFDGDGITDPAKYVESAGAIWYQESGNSYTPVGVYLGNPVTAPYDVVN